MKFFESLLLLVGKNFTTEVYMFYTKLQGMIWSIADIVLVLVLLKIADLIRKRSQKKRITLRYVFLLVSAILTPLLIFTKTPRQFLLLESIICGTQFSILVYTVIVEIKEMVKAVKKISIMGR